jgi:hypothetical protein
VGRVSAVDRALRLARLGAALFGRSSTRRVTCARGVVSLDVVLSLPAIGIAPPYFSPGRRASRRDRTPWHPRHYEGIQARIPVFTWITRRFSGSHGSGFGCDATDNAFLLPNASELELGPALAAPCSSQVAVKVATCDRPQQPLSVVVLLRHLRMACASRCSCLAYESWSESE